MITTEIGFWKSVIGVGSSCFALYNHCLAFGSFWERKKLPKWAWRLFCVFFVACCFFTEHLSIILLNTAVSFFLSFLVSCFYQNRFRSRLVFTILYFCLFALLDYGVGFALSFLFQDSFLSLVDSSILFYFCVVTICQILMYLASKLIRMLRLSTTEQYSLTDTAASLIIPISALIMALLMMRVSDMIYQMDLELALSACLALLVVANFSVIYLLGKRAELEQAKQRLDAVEKQNKMKLEYDKRLYEGQQEIRKIRHDMKNLMITLIGLEEAGHTKEAVRCLKEYVGHLNEIAEPADTKIPSLNAVLSAKQREAQRRQIQFTYQAVQFELKIDEINFGILIATALDNALEACERLEEGAERYISMKIVPIEEYLMVEIQNPDPEPGRIVGKTWKADSKNHGFGLETIERITKQNSGSIQISREDGVFTLKILLQNYQ